MEDDYIKWRNLIGDYMLMFAKVEGELNDLLADLTSGIEYDDVVSQPFKARQSKVKLLLKDRVSDSCLVNDVNKLLDKLLNFAENEKSHSA